MIFQDPYASLNPRMTAGATIGEPLAVYGVGSKDERSERVRELLATVGLNPDYGDRYPHEFSGGQRQRIGIARALALEPSLVICDEPVSALDVSIQAQVVNLLMDLQDRLGLALIFISHNLSVVRHISHDVMVMCLGRVVEAASRDDFYSGPLHPYSRALMDAVPEPDPVRERGRLGLSLPGELPSPLAPPPGCVFASRCPHVEAICHAERPALRLVAPGRLAACHFVEPVR